MRGSLHRAALATFALLGCDYAVWLSEDLDAGERADAAALRDAANDAAPDADRLDADGPDADGPDAGAQRACERGPVPLGTARATDPLSQPTFAVSGHLGSPRYGVLVPPAASRIATEDTRLIIADADGATLRERALRVTDGAGAPASTATLHALPADGEGFLILGPTAIWLLSADGEGEPLALAVPPRAEWQRSAGWLDDDRFAFVSDAPALPLAVLERAARAVSATTVSAVDAACVHIERGGVTISRAGPTTEVVVYEPALDGAEALRSAWDDGTPLAGRLLAAATHGSERVWIVRDANEFRTAVTAVRVPAGSEPVPGSSITLLSPITASLEGTVFAIQGSGPALWTYSLELATFSPLPAPPGDALVEPERDGERLAVLGLRPDGASDLALELSCGLR
ncbi:MAG: hypothetical protein KF729_03490 [Sandaracinaceae bacterium]|nr:hypothetical protein [Sandaracinaceae bacterium]